MEQKTDVRNELFNDLRLILLELKPEHEEIILDFFKTQIKALALFRDKQYDYGPENISNFGDIGVLVRLNDKIERLKNLMFSDKEAHNESIVDTWIDIGNYGLIGLMCANGTWPNVKQYEITKVEGTDDEDPE